MGCGCGRRAGIERALCLCLGVGHGGEVGGAGRKLAERVGQRVGVRGWGGCCWGVDKRP